MFWKASFASRILLVCVALPLIVSALASDSQAPFRSISPSWLSGTDNWDLALEPALWPNTRLRNGHNIVPGVLPVGTLLYHGTSSHQVPEGPNWTAVDPEHSFIFCNDLIRNGTGCWQLTFAVTHPLKVLYFDGSGAAKMWGGSMDSQDLFAWGSIQPNRTFDEQNRTIDMCAWGKSRDINGFVRMEMDFEVIVCDFAVKLEIISFLNLSPVNAGTLPYRRDPPDSAAFRVLEAGKWHDRFPSENRIKLDYTRIISFYDVSLFPSLQHHRQSQERWDHRLEMITPSETAAFIKILDNTLPGLWGASTSGIDWPTLLTVVEQRYNERLEMLEYILFSLAATSDRTLKDVLKQAHRHLGEMLAPYTLNSIYPPRRSSRLLELATPSDAQWAAPIFKECATAHTRYLANPSISSTFTHSEKLLLRATQDTLREICRVLVGMWAEGVVTGLIENPQNNVTGSDDPSSDQLKNLVKRWKHRTHGLMNWLDWSYWATCQPACSYEEMCYLPTWPFIKRWPKPEPSPDPDQLPAPSPGEDGYRPSPRCIRRLEPYGF
ncbi:hypothetical protein CPB83DRAFT_908335 [Crepidotus variabilis]|uniref:Uncharacterized protein n=1 Tax=Crepidotus variabilis TaxID=179855 RepID=A0A9P6ECM8_9AGAR|nr:hypothetical protein CPB83DRAFT_908335 [Crepidotus variabilis]